MADCNKKQRGEPNSSEGCSVTEFIIEAMQSTKSGRLPARIRDSQGDKCTFTTPRPASDRCLRYSRYVQRCSSGHAEGATVALYAHVQIKGMFIIHPVTIEMAP